VEVDEVAVMYPTVGEVEPFKLPALSPYIQPSFPISLSPFAFKLVIVAVDIVAFVPINESVIVVLALVVLAFKVWKLPVVPHSVPMIA
jgi:hypothetical protein